MIQSQNILNIMPKASYNWADGYIWTKAVWRVWDLILICGWVQCNCLVLVNSVTESMPERGIVVVQCLGFCIRVQKSDGSNPCTIRLQDLSPWLKP